METGRTPVIDEIDRKILRELVRDGRLSIRRLAERVGLSTSATSERVRRLEAHQIVTGYRAILSPQVLDRPYDAVIGVRASPTGERSTLEAWLSNEGAVVEVLHLTGPHDYLVRAHCKNAEELDDLLMRMKAEAEVAETETRVVLRSLPVNSHLV